MDYSHVRYGINKVIPLSDEEWAFFESMVNIKILRKNHFLFKEGDVCSKLYYILKGGVRMYYLNNNGTELTYDFLIENNFTTAFSSFIKQGPSSENIILIEDSIFLELPFDNYQKLQSRNTVWQLFFNKLFNKYILRKSEREEMLLLNDIDTRFQKILKDKPYLFQRVEQQYIASYLGVTPETLSRIKKRLHRR